MNFFHAVIQLVLIYNVSSFKTTSTFRISRLERFLQGWSELQIKDLQGQQIGSEKRGESKYKYLEI